MTELEAFRAGYRLRLAETVKQAGFWDSAMKLGLGAGALALAVPLAAGTIGGSAIGDRVGASDLPDPKAQLREEKDELAATYAAAVERLNAAKAVRKAQPPPKKTFNY